MKIDAKLTRSIDLFIIGGASAILGYNVIKQTNDVDVDGALDNDFRQLFNETSRKEGLDIGISSVGVFSPPEGYRERMIFQDLPCKKLRIWTLDQYDLAISKMDRGLDKDFTDILKVHKKVPYSAKRLIELFMNEYLGITSIGSQQAKTMNFLDLIEKRFGEEEMKKAAKQLGFKSP